MVSVILIWIYMIVTCYITGFSCIRTITGKQGWHCKKESSILFAGIAAVTVYAQFFSIFHKVGLSANIILLGICLISGFFYRKELTEHIHTVRLTITPVKAGVALLLFLLFAYGTSGGMIHYDTSLYHAQSIRWIEEFGIVPGLGNLHSRLAYNSASFCLSALYSFAFLGGQSYHACAGFVAFLLAVVCMEMFWQKRWKEPKLSHFVRLMGFYYLLTLFDEMVSPASDYFMVISVFYLLIRWLDLIEEKEDSYVPFAMLCVLCVSVVTIKLSGALILLLTVKPAVMMIKRKKGKEIGKFLGVGFVTVLPFFVRNIILSGWVVYPFTFLDLFTFDFKIPKGMADYDAKEIQVWGRGFRDVTRFDEPITKWIRDWAMSLDGTNKVFLLLALSGLVMLAGLCVYALLKRKKEMLDFLLTAGTVAVCFVFWLTSAPLVRYGCVYLWVLPVLIWGFFYLKISAGLDRFKIYYILLSAAILFKMGNFVLETSKAATGDYLIRQKDYENFDTVAYELHGYTFYYPKEGDRTGYEDFPASPVKAADIFRGESIKEGFRDVIHQENIN